jgi:signal transduction histidine kinase
MRRNKKPLRGPGEVLLCAPFGKDPEILQRIVLSEISDCLPCTSLDEVAQRISDVTDCILLTEEAVAPRAFSAFQEALRKQPPWSDVPIVLMASAGANPSRGATLFLSKLQGANISILERPARIPTILSVLRTAKSARNRQREVQKLLLQERESALQLRLARDQLEIRVKERTAALSRTNLELTREIKERKRMESDLRTLSARMLRIQDDERRRMARELHDGVGQTLSAALMAASQAMTSKDQIPTSCESGIRQVEEMLQLGLREVRTVSHLLHPPLLDESGLMSAIRWYVEGFSRRSNIPVTLDLDESQERLSQDLETAAFRIIQEALTNVHRHSAARSVRISLKRNGGTLSLQIEDDGRGIPSELLQATSTGRKGVGLASMQERASLLGGKFTVESDRRGTRISVVMPVSVAAG